MKPGVRALGIAESYRGDRSTLCGAVTTADGVPDGFIFADCTVGGLDVTAAIAACWDGIDRDDVQYVFVSGVALAWYNIVDVDQLATAIDVPTILLTFEDSEGLDDALAEHFEGEALAERRRRYEALPDRVPVELADGRIFARVVGSLDRGPAEVVTRFTRAGRRPEPVRIARLAARAADRWAGDEPETT